MRLRLCDKRLRLLAAAAIVGACSAATRHAPDTIVFSHNVHTEQGVACGDCHKGLGEDAEREVDPIMKMAACGDCHDVDSATGCGTCHTNASAPGTYARTPATHLLFSHERHEARAPDCARCHAKAANAPAISAKNRLLPGHPQCDTCHQRDMDSGRCQLCHDRLDLYARKPETLYSHEPGFFERHGLKAAGGQDVCATCHDASYCSDCHAKTMTANPSIRFPERAVRNFVHDGDYISRHVIEARSGDTSCMKCHGTSFCAACHERTGVGGATGRVSPHPATWMQAGAADSHSRAARRRIAECASCHDQGPASICVRCHSTGGVNPHPPGWKAPVPRADRAKHKMCGICHTD
jgi:hypothetical protein